MRMLSAKISLGDKCARGDWSGVVWRTAAYFFADSLQM